MWAVSWTNQDSSKECDASFYSEATALSRKAELETEGKTNVTVTDYASLQREHG